MSKRKETTNSTASTTTASPIGLTIGTTAANTWRIGKLLGQGACGSVHELVKDPPIASQQRASSSSVRQWAVKVAAVPTANKISNNKKRKKTAQERNADTIHLERTLMCNQLSELSGIYIPNTPQYGDTHVPPAYGDVVLDNSSKSISTTTFTFLVMERMESSLASWATILSGATMLGAVAQRMLDCIQQLHLVRLVYVDLKMESFMMTIPTTNSKFNSQNLHKCLRLIDFGLVENLYDAMTGKHRDDAVLGAMAGTPLYASCNVMEGHLPSRRDDLESLGYVVADLILMSSSEETTNNTCLPWKDAKSDLDILLLKKSATQNLYEKMSANDAKALKAYMDTVRQLLYSDKPNYGLLSTFLGQICGGGINKNLNMKATGASYSSISTSTASSSISRKKKNQNIQPDEMASVSSAFSSSRPRRECASKHSSSEQFIEIPRTDNSRKKKHHNIQPEKKTMNVASAFSSSRPKRQCASKHSSSEQFIEIHSTDDDDDEVVAMDWEPVFIEEEDNSSNNNNFKENDKPTLSSTNSSACAFKLHFLEGPSKGSFLDAHVGSTITIGKETQKKKTSSAHYTVADQKIAPKHLKLAIQMSKFKSYSIRVTDLGSGATIVKGKILAKGASVQCFAGDQIQFGSSSLVIMIFS